jgi:hypothetical protein
MERLSDHRVRRAYSQIVDQGAMFKTFSVRKFTTFRNTLKCLSLASLSSLA